MTPLVGLRHRLVAGALLATAIGLAPVAHAQGLGQPGGLGQPPGGGFGGPTPGGSKKKGAPKPAGPETHAASNEEAQQSLQTAEPSLPADPTAIPPGIAKRIGTNVTAVTREDTGDGPRIRVDTLSDTAFYDQVVLAGHSDQSLAMLRDPSAAEQRVLSAIRYQPNRAVLHTDASCLPANRKTWSAWNYQSESGGMGTGSGGQRVCVHYLINRLQPLPFSTPVIVSLNPIDAPAPQQVIASYDYAHPVFDNGAIAAQRQLSLLQGSRGTWFAGAWTGYGFHEDGLKSGLAAADALLAQSTFAPPQPIAA